MSHTQYRLVKGILFGLLAGLVVGFGNGCGGSNTSYPKSVYVLPMTETAFAADVERSTIPVVVDFYAVWCGPCKLQAPTLDKLAEEFSGRAKFVQVNVDKEQALAQRFNVQAIPTLLVFHQGKVVETYVGLTPAPTLKARLETLVGTGK